MKTNVGVSILLICIVASGCINEEQQIKEPSDRQEITIGVWNLNGWNQRENRGTYADIAAYITQYDILIIQNLGEEAEQCCTALHQQVPTYDYRIGSYPHIIFFNTTCTIEEREDLGSTYPNTYENPPFRLAFTAGSLYFNVVAIKLSAERADDEAKHLKEVYGKHTDPTIMGGIAPTDYNKKKHLNAWTQIIGGKSTKTVAPQSDTYTIFLCNAPAMRQYSTWEQRKTEDIASAQEIIRITIYSTK